MLFFCPLYLKNKNFLGLNRFNLISKYTKKATIALGGISKKNLKQLKLTDAYGFAGISFLNKKRPLKRGPFK